MRHSIILYVVLLCGCDVRAFNEQMNTKRCGTLSQALAHYRDCDRTANCTISEYDLQTRRAFEREWASRSCHAE